jgi:hypothetical protein
MNKITLTLFTLLSYFGSYAATTLTDPVFQKSNYVTFEKAEASFTIAFNGGNYSNPFDSSVVSVDALITLPDNSIITVPCFYFYPAAFHSTSTVNWWDATENASAAKWLLRYAPKTAGTHTISIRVIDANGTTTSTGTALITVSAGSNKGFVRTDATNNQFMRFDNATPYYPIGENLAWATPGTLVSFYNTYLNHLGDNKATWIRYWLTGFARQALEWQSTHWSGWYGGLGQYSQRAAGLLDSIVNNCERKGIYMQLVLQQHGQFSEVVDSNWPENPYNSANEGGIMASPCSFFTDASAMAQTKKQYRYIVARWGYSSNIFAWELFNEVNFAGTNNGAGQLAPCTPADVASWHNTMSDYLKSIDVNQHMVTTSTGNAGNPLLSLMDGNNTSLDILQYHSYPGAPIENSMVDNANTAKAAYTKPVLCGEFGISGTTVSSVSGDLWADHIRKPLWTGLFNEVPAMYWYWDSTYMQRKALYNVFKPLSTFLEGVDIVGETGGNSKPLNFAVNPSSAGIIQAIPGMSWGNSTQQDFTIDAGGNITGLQNLSSYLAGAWHPGMGNYASFTVTYASAGTAKINVSASNSPPNNVEIFIDGVSVANSNFSAAGSLSASVAAGPHVIKFQMNGNDWVNVSSYDFTVSSSKCLAYGYSGTNTAYGYIYDKSLSEWQNPSTVTDISAAKIIVRPLTSGNYQVDYFDPQSGTSFNPGGVYATVDDSIVVHIPSFKKDLAFKVYATNANPTSVINSNNTFTEKIYCYPNPAENELKVEIPFSVGGICNLTVYNIVGEPVLTRDIKLISGPNLLSLDISSLPSSLYFIRIDAGGGKEKGGLKFIKR